MCLTGYIDHGRRKSAHIDIIPTVLVLYRHPRFIALIKDDKDCSVTIRVVMYIIRAFCTIRMISMNVFLSSKSDVKRI